MTRDEYLLELAEKLEALNISSSDNYPEKRRIVQFYREMIEDRIEDGLSEEEAVAGMEGIDGIVERARREFVLPEIASGPGAPAEAGEAAAEPITAARAEGEFTFMTRTYARMDMRRVSVQDANRGVEVASGDWLQIEYVDGPDGHYEVDCSGGTLRARFIPAERNSIRSIFGAQGHRMHPFKLTLPKVQPVEAYVRTTNGSILVRGPMTVGAFETTNGRIDAEGVSGERVKFATANGGIRLLRVSANAVTAESANARIEADRVAADEITLITSNGANEARSIGGGRVRIETQNGQITADNVSGDDIALASANGAIVGTIRGRMSDFAITSRTSNGRCNLPAVSDGKKKLDVRTSNARIEIAFAE